MVEEPAVMEAQEVPTAEETTLPEEEIFNFGSSKKKKENKEKKDKKYKKKGLASWTDEKQDEES